MAIVVSFLFSLVPLLIVSELQVHEALALLIGGGSIALLGFWDDHGHVSKKSGFWVILQRQRLFSH